jgi:hypothetical protein
MKQRAIVARGRYLANGIARCFWCHSRLEDGASGTPMARKLNRLPREPRVLARKLIVYLASQEF